ncbi:MAG: hypothetical protein ACQEXV_18980 [Bacillota bacterium]|uniref:hypothetical protein n=1 Tax=Paenibacillus jamilae TaxID=114136 RepID=UPI000E3BC893|nr:hypothetical protein [Paenibacillus jamilae]RFT93266.1 hypothetical protein DX902_22335 [Paenibacillus jamilae]
MKKIFLESTINIERHFAKLSRQQEIRENLRGNEIITSNYVIGELKGNFLLNSCALHRILLEEETVEDALRRFGSVFYSTRQMSRALTVYSYIAENVGYDKEAIIDRLEILIEDVLEDMLVEDIDHVIDECRCVKAYVKPERTKRGFTLNMGCRQKPKPSCSIENFYVNHKLELLKISNNKDKNIEKMTDLLQRTINNQASKVGKNCWKLGDAVIATEVSNEYEIYTTNKKDFIPISKEIEKKLYQEI